MADPIALLRAQQEKRLVALGQQRSDRQQRLSRLQQREGQLKALIADYSGSGCQDHALLLANRSQMASQLRPLVDQCQRQQAVASADLAALEGQWRHQLGRRQGLVWLEGEKRKRRQTTQRRQEQKQMDEMASRAKRI
ncbi:flagellar FliJ family protein [Ferrimonas balearica]|uniref:flagellar FliJ family protein n=1 Tax=Ferrimonas balearica TaxID=44012 RepID=UPI001C99B4A2|nr:flagellar FliJ family protein [Ferrimonas balearica]MBY5991991.1 flagellar FliJ family protein [Ferrimonas balearica]